MDIIIFGLIAVFSAGVVAWIYIVLADKHYRKEQSDVDRLSDRIKDNKDEQ